MVDGGVATVDRPPPTGGQDKTEYRADLEFRFGQVTGAQMDGEV